MLNIIGQKILAFLFPGGFILLMAVIFSSTDHYGAWATLINNFLPHAIYPPALYLGWRFNRSRLFFAVFQLYVFFLYLFLYPQLIDLSIRHHQGMLHDVALLLPLNLIILAFGREQGIFTIRGAIRFIFILLQLLLLEVLFSYKVSITQLIGHEIVHLDLPASSPLSQPVLIIFLVTYMLLTIAIVKKRDAVNHGYFWALTAVFLAMRFISGAGGPFYFGIAGLIFLVAAIETVHALTFRDELTGLPGRRALNDNLKMLGQDYVIAMLDIDHFKKFNDKYGHDTGDQVLCMVASQISKIAGGGRAYRYGGEEFIIVYPKKSMEQVIPYLEGLRTSIASTGFSLRSPFRPAKKPKGKSGRQQRNKKIHITVSIGLAQSGKGGRRPSEVIKAADNALYRAKKNGRNRITTR